MLKYIQSFFVIIIFSMCSNNSTKNLTNSEIIRPKIVTDTVLNNSDDPAIWINKRDYSKSLIIGTDKGKDGLDGALFVFDLEGKEIKNKTIRGLKRPNNVDIAYKLKFDSSYIDIAVCTERNTNSIRVFSLPEMEPIDNGGIQVFLGDSLRFPMGVGLYTKENGKIFAIVSRKSGPLENYIWQYELVDNGNRAVTGSLVRKFGKFSGKKEIEAIAVDNELGYVYYSDEGVGIRKYFADPDSSNLELALFTDDQFLSDIEGISIYKESNKNGFILVSDQQANKFHIFTREGTDQNPNDHRLVKIINLSTIESDGSDVTNIPLPGFLKGLFVAMSNPKVFHYYNLEDFFR